MSAACCLQPIRSWQPNAYWLPPIAGDHPTLCLPVDRSLSAVGNVYKVASPRNVAMRHAACEAFENLLLCVFLWMCAGPARVPLSVG